jgi:hypothetical protein
MLPSKQNSGWPILMTQTGMIPKSPPSLASRAFSTKILYVHSGNSKATRHLQEIDVPNVHNQILTSLLVAAVIG